MSHLNDCLKFTFWFAHVAQFLSILLELPLSLHVFEKHLLILFISLMQVSLHGQVNVIDVVNCAQVILHLTRVVAYAFTLNQISFCQSPAFRQFFLLLNLPLLFLYFLYCIKVLLLPELVLLEAIHFLFQVNPLQPGTLNDVVNLTNAADLQLVLVVVHRLTDVLVVHAQVLQVCMLYLDHARRHSSVVHGAEGPLIVVNHVVHSDYAASTQHVQDLKVPIAIRDDCVNDPGYNDVYVIAVFTNLEQLLG